MRRHRQAPASSGSAADSKQGASRWAWIVGAIPVVLILVLALFILGSLLGWFSSNGSSSSDGAGETAASSPADDAAGDQADSSEIRTFIDARQKPSAPSSDAFVRSVKDAFITSYNATHDVNTKNTAYSPTTAVIYQMECEEMDEFVRCTGGNNAVVNIS